MICGHCKRNDAGVTTEHVRYCTARPTPRNSAERRDASYAELNRARELVPEGRYALRGNDGTWDFYQVDKPVEGQWKGFTFINLMVSDGRQRLGSRKAELTILLRIAADPRQAAIDYGKQVGQCSICGRTLTNPESIEAGIGPICAGKMGW